MFRQEKTTISSSSGSSTTDDELEVHQDANMTYSMEKQSINKPYDEIEEAREWLRHFSVNYNKS